MLLKNKKYIYNLLLFTFLFFTLNDLIDMHIRVIFNVDISANYNSSGQTTQTYAKVKPDKKEKKSNNSSGHKIHFKNNEEQNNIHFVLLDEIVSKNSDANLSELFLNKLKGRAPPIS